MAKFGTLPEVVKFIEFGKEHFALVIGSKSPTYHTGDNDEPVLDLVIVAPVLNPLDPKHEEALNLVGTSRQGELVKIQNDVPHDSHEFTQEGLDALQKQGFTVSQIYPGNRIPGGRWRELSSAELADGQAIRSQQQSASSPTPNAPAVVTPAAPEKTKAEPEPEGGTGSSTVQ